MDRPVTIILGAGATIGVAIARMALAEGHGVVMCDPDDARIESARDAVTGDVAFHAGPTHTLLGLRNGLAAAREAFGRVDHVVGIPAIPSPDTLQSLQLEEFDRTLGQSVKGAALALRLFSDAMLDQPPLEIETIQRHPQRGSFTFVLSLSALLSDPDRFSEGVSQAAVLGVVRSGAVSLAADRIRVNAVAAIRPRAQKDEDWLVERTPMGRAALADEVARAVININAPDAGYMTGQVVTLDGGRSVLNGLIRESG